MKDLIKASEAALKLLEQIFYDDRKEVVNLKKALAVAKDQKQDEKTTKKTLE